MELRFARARPLFRLRSAYADPKVPFRGIYETDRGNGKAAVSRRVAVSRCGQASRRGYVADVPLPGDCHATATPSLAMTRRYGCTLGWRRGEGAPPYRDFTDSRCCHAIHFLPRLFRPLTRCGVRAQPQGGEPPRASGLARVRLVGGGARGPRPTEA